MPPRQATKPAAQQKRALSNVTSQLAALESMSTAELTAKYLELEGVQSRSRNRQYLIKRVAWLIQAAADGGLPDAAKQRIATLGDALPFVWRERVDPAPAAGAGKPGKQAKRGEADAAPGRDQRLPPVGSTFSRTVGRVVHTVKVLADGLEYRGQRYASVSQIAREITGTKRNGYRFFKLV